MPNIYQGVQIAQFLIFLYCGWTLVMVYRQKTTVRSKLLFVAGAAAALDLFAYIEVLNAGNARYCGSYVCMESLATIIFYTAAACFMMKVVGLEMTKGGRGLMWSLIAAFVLLMLADEHFGLLFRSLALKKESIAVRLVCTPGVLGIAFFAYNCVLAACCLLLGLFGTLNRKTDTITKYIAIWSVLPLSFYVLYFFGLTGGLNVKPTLELCFVCVVLRANKKYHVLDDGEIAREQILEEVGEGYLVLDANRRLCDYNAIAAMLYPELEQPGECEVMVELIFLHNHGMLEHNGKICSIVVSDLKEYGDLVGYVVWLYDSTDEYYCMKELRELKEQVRLTKQTSELYLRHMTDGMDSPIQIVQGRATAISQDENTPKDVAEMTQEIMEAGQKLDDMVSVMKGYPFHAVSREECQGSNYHTNELLKGLKEILSERKKAYCREVSLHVAEGFPSEWNGDCQAITALVGQILRYAGICARIWGVDLELSHEIRHLDAMMHVTLVLSDHGIMTSEWNRLSLMVVKGNKEIEHELSYLPFDLCRQMILRLDATVDCNVELEQSKIVIHIPQKIMNQDMLVEHNTEYMKMGEAAETAEPENTPEKHGKPVVMVVDDNIIYLREMDSWLRKLNLKTVLAKSGEDALHILEKRPVDMIFMDQMMPGMDGTKVLEKVREWEKENGRIPMPVILLTADNTVGARRRYLAFGFNDYLPKPIQPQQICDLVRIYLNM